MKHSHTWPITLVIQDTAKKSIFVMARGSPNLHNKRQTTFLSGCVHLPVPVVLWVKLWSGNPVTCVLHYGDLSDYMM